MIDAKRLDAIKRRTMVGSTTVGVGDTITNAELFELIQSRAIALKELRIIYDRHDVREDVQEQCHAQAVQLLLEAEQGPVIDPAITQAGREIGKRMLDSLNEELNKLQWEPPLNREPKCG